MTTIAARKTRKTDTLVLNKQAIKQYDLTLRNDEFEFFVDSELDAYKAAYVYRNSEVRVVFAENTQRWMVIVARAPKA